MELMGSKSPLSTKKNQYFSLHLMIKHLLNNKKNLTLIPRHRYKKYAVITS